MKSSSWLLTLLVLVCISYYGRTDAGCKPISFDFVKRALDACVAVKYNETEFSQLKVDGDHYMKDANNKKLKFKYETVLFKTWNDKKLAAFSASTTSTTIIAFRGVSASDPTPFFKKLQKATKAEAPFNNGTTKVFQDFIDDYMTLLGGKSLLKNGFNTSMKYIITGHGVGGALASMYALKQVQNGMWADEKENVLITFGQPRTGNEAYADTHDQLIPPYKKLRFVDKRDPWATVPSKSKSFKHHSTKVVISDNQGEKTKKIRFCSEGDNPDGCNKFKSSDKSFHAIESYRDIIRISQTFLNRTGLGAHSFEDAQCPPTPRAGSFMKVL